MKNDTEGRNLSFSLLLTNASDLMEKKSVRATFKLSAEFIEVISILSSQLGIKQKSLFDHLMEDIESLRTIAGQIESEKSKKRRRVQKTFVISKKSLSSLDSVSKKFAASRNDIVEYSIKRLLPILAKEQEKQKKREVALNKISKHFDETTRLLEEINELLKDDDSVYTLFNGVFETYKNAYSNIEEFVTKGKRITSFPMEKL